MARPQFKLTCFYCKYEIVNSKSCKSVIYKNSTKYICKYCTPRKHKPCLKKYAGLNTECKVCNKPVKYNKCLPCSICNHFIHGHCNELNSCDIKKIEQNASNNFICILCISDIFPGNISNSNINNNAKTVSCNQQIKNKNNHCFTCTRPIDKKRYLNKYALYENKKIRFCYTCSIQNLNIPVRNISSLEFLDCSICKKIVKYESVYCNLCQHWVHPYCNNLDANMLTELSKSDTDWYCKTCTYNIFPNFLINTKEQNSDDQYLKNLDNFQTYDNCEVCMKTVTGNNTLCCYNCRHWIHKNCIGKFTNAEFQNFLDFYSNREWTCPECLSNMLPFIKLSDEEFNYLLIEMNSNSVSINSENIKTIYNKLNNYNLLTDKYNNDDKYNTDIDPDSNLIQHDKCDYIIDIDRLNQNSNFSIMTFNIRSIKRNFEELGYLLSQIKMKLHIYNHTK